MDYEQKYNAALERAKEYHDNGGAPLILEVIFPELKEKESEGDRTRKAILTGLIDCRDAPDLGWSDFGGINIDECIAWLEKQGEQNFDYEHADIPQKDFAPIEQKTLNAEKQGHMLDTNKVIEWLCSNSTLFGAKWCKTENIIEQFKKDFGL